jgi:hypothetical protein
MRHIGDRVTAILKCNESTVWLFGYGTYQGDVKPDPELGVAMWGVSIEHEVPCIKLDSGKLVFGPECWWGSESAMKARVEGKSIVMVDIDAERAKAKETI